jgi:hypothetical protein
LGFVAGLEPVDGQDRDEAARRAGVERRYLERLSQLGIIRADGALSRGDVRRVQVTKLLTDWGIPLEAIAATLNSGRLTLDFLDSPVYERFAALTTETFAQT